MTESVVPPELADQVRAFGDVAYLVTVGAAGAPHVVAARVAFGGARFVVPAGPRSATNVEQQPSVTLVWPARPGGSYSLIVDGTGQAHSDGADAVVEIEPTGAVLHRTPEGDPSEPSCVRLMAPP